MREFLITLSATTLVGCLVVWGYALRVSLHARSVGVRRWYASLITGSFSVLAAVLSVVLVVGWAR